DEEAEVACIGQAGENLVRFASIMVGGHRAGGRGGGGCVFGSKNLKAIAARGTQGLPVRDPGGLFDAIREFRKYKERDPGSAFHKRYGTLANIRDLHLVGFLAYRNHQGHLVPADQIDRTDHNWYANNIGVRAEACSAGCAYACGGWYHLKGNESAGARRHAGEWGPKPEFGSVNPFANACDMPDLPEVCHVNKMCNDYGMDVMETAMGIAFLMELWDRGIITGQDTFRWTGETISLEWGNQEAVERIIEAVALHKNELGDLLSGGVYKAAMKIEDIKNVPALKYALYGKGGATHEAQGRLPSSGLYMAVATVGAHHTKGMGISAAVSEKYLGTTDGGRPDGSMWQGEPTKEQSAVCSSKGAGHALSEYFAAIVNSLGVCLFLGAHRTLREVPPEVLSKALLAVTGAQMTPGEMVTAGERVVNLQKAFNSRLGLRREDDTACHRWMNEPLQEGLAKGARLGELLELLKDGYYQYHGWGRKTSLQTRQKLEELDMADVATVLAKEGALAGGAGEGE
ncbi:MAG: aldehyde ferredoxin oxidoreductase C-terminal domain-containing protein, partial [Dehalococcoidia bacterium]|nr:aldehyde ferredoxin oxidoreductase C-terminal domain-containing protein [Dehalococcoidia bacterium]